MISKNTKLWLARAVVWIGYAVIASFIGITILGLILMLSSIWREILIIIGFFGVCGILVGAVILFEICYEWLKENKENKESKNE